MSGLAREIVKWIQSLDLSHAVRNTRRDFSNGYLVAEIFSWYYPQEIQMHSYDNGTSLQTKLGNWSQLERFFQRQGFDIPAEIIEGTIHCKPRAAALLMEKIYTHLTNRTVKSLPSEEEADFTDRAYQIQLPAHARSTASMCILAVIKLIGDTGGIPVERRQVQKGTKTVTIKKIQAPLNTCNDTRLHGTQVNYAQVHLDSTLFTIQAIKNNIANTELSTDPDMILCRQKAQAIINDHVEHRRQERVENPARFGIRPTLGQLCPRKVPPPNYGQTVQETRDLPPEKDNDSVPVNYTEIQVNQLTDGHEGFLPLHTGSAMFSHVY